MTADELRAIAARHAKDDTALYYTGDTAETMHQDRSALLAIVRRVAEMDALEFFDDRRGMGYECRFCDGEAVDFSILKDRQTAFTHTPDCPWLICQGVRAGAGRRRRRPG